MKLDYLQENVNMGVMCFFDLACLSHRMHAEKCDKHLFVSYLFNTETPARCVINSKIKTSNIFWSRYFNSVAN